MGANDTASSAKSWGTATSWEMALGRAKRDREVVCTLALLVAAGLSTLGCGGDCPANGTGDEGSGASSTAAVSTTSSQGGQGGTGSGGGAVEPGCSMPCGDDAQCVDGVCVPLCGELTRCDGACRDVRVDPEHCGACGAVCAFGEACSDGLCCPSDARNCAGTCRPVAQDPDNCGACDNACAGGQACVSGDCVSVCPEGFELIDRACASVVDGAIEGYTDGFGGPPESCDALGDFPFVVVTTESHLRWLDPGALGAPQRVTLEFERGVACAAFEMASSVVTVRLNGGAELSFDAMDAAADCACSSSTPLLITLDLEPNDLFVGHENDVTLQHEETLGLRAGGALGDALFRVTVAY
jgi:hypothetical protein